MSDVDRNRLRVCESLVDEHFDSLKLPGPSWEEAAWYLLTVSDDTQRFGLIGLSLKPEDEFARVGPAIATGFIDEHKYAIRQALLLARRLPRAKHIWNRCIEVDGSEVAAAVIERAISYATICRFFAACHEGATEFACPDERTLILSPGVQRLQYATLEGLLGMFAKPRRSFLGLFFEWAIRGTAPRVIHEIVGACRSLPGRVEYRMPYDAIRDYAMGLRDEERLVPAAWKFPWGGTAADTLRLLEILQSMALFHACVVHYAQYGRINDHGSAALLMVFGRRQLVRHLAVASGLDVMFVNRLMTALTYGEGTRAPDPVLQPAVPLADGAVAIAPLTIMGGDFQRNILSLHSRLDPRSFDEQSALFEVAMAADIAVSLSDAKLTYRSNFMSPAGRKREEIDLVIVDVDASLIVYLELRWMLPPGDPREVMNRRKVCTEKVAQLDRKVRSARDHMDAVLDALDIAKPRSGWRIDGAVVIDGFAGYPSDGLPDVLVVPSVIVKSTIGQFASLERWFDWLETKAWLPSPGKDFVVEPFTIDFGLVRIDSSQSSLLSNEGFFGSVIDSAREYERKGVRNAG